MHFNLWHSEVSSDKRDRDHSFSRECMHKGGKADSERPGRHYPTVNTSIVWSSSDHDQSHAKARPAAEAKWTADKLLRLVYWKESLNVVSQYNHQNDVLGWR